MKSLKLLATCFILFFTACKTDDIKAQTASQEAIENGLVSPIQIKGEAAKKHSILERMKMYKVPGVSIAVVENGQIKWTKGYGIANTNTGTQVDVNTIFQAGSISKPIAALAALQLVQNGKLDLDTDVNNYLKGWKIPDGKFTDSLKISLRLLLTHTAGMTVHGFPGYKQKDKFPSIIEVLNGKGNTTKIFVDTTPGSIWRYAGGGYTVMEKVVEDVSGESLENYMANHVFPVMEMKNSTYQQPLGPSLHANASAAYNGNGDIIEGLWNNYPEQAAAGLWTTPTDLAKYMIQIQEILKGKKNGVLSKNMVEQMLTKHKNNWGLGPSLQWEKDSLIFRHGGKNAGFTNDMMAFAHRGDGIIVMTNADNGGKLIGEIMRAASNHYGWGTNKQQIVETFEMPVSELEKYTGKYKLDYEVPNIGKYYINIKREDHKLVVVDANNGETNVIIPIGKTKFMEMESGSTFTFSVKDGKLGVLINNRFRFDKE